jgi:hypothetical protein
MSDEDGWPQFVLIAAYSSLVICFCSVRQNTLEKLKIIVDGRKLVDIMRPTLPVW